MPYTSLYFVLNQRIHILLYHYCFTHIVMALYYIHFLQRPVLNYQINRSFRFIGFKPTIPLNNTHTHTFKGPLSGTTRVSQYQKGKTNLDFTEARDSEWQWHQLGRMQVCTSLQTDNHASTPLLTFFYRPDALPVAQPTVSKH